MDFQKNYVVSSWCFQLFWQKAYAVGCPSICEMVSVQGEKSFSPYFLALKIMIGKDVTIVKTIAAKSGWGKLTMKNWESKK